MRDVSRAGRPLGAYAGLITTYNSLFALFLIAMRLSGRRLPASVATQDVLLIGAATQQLSRLVTRDKITTVVRAPFTVVEREADEPGELEEVAVGHGWRRAVGELLTCPYCITAWIASLLACGLATAPRETRLVTGIFASVAVSDFLNHLYRASIGLADRLQADTSAAPVVTPIGHQAGHQDGPEARGAQAPGLRAA
ncbi:MAG: hypothetical protein AVDCRST_MAG77-3696 [uncultured Chloroflexi bacterium]|uniref:Integral membrane protein n=1 Tax=uncultured Chloroflexota bacterium TaxID=166587 RepID=A0A6J4JJS5_9CHLR|nr:MAG: hypothetical protein AVDCRST_MAG77-3696 [uncultured Chloroflexota bacterium]